MAGPSFQNQGPQAAEHDSQQERSASDACTRPQGRPAGSGRRTGVPSMYGFPPRLGLETPSPQNPSWVLSFAFLLLAIRQLPVNSDSG